MAKTTVVKLTKKTADYIQEYVETIQVYHDPKNPEVLANFLSGMRRSVLSDPSFNWEPHHLACALRGTVKFTDKSPKSTWFANIGKLTWKSGEMFLEKSKVGIAICEEIAKTNAYLLDETLRLLFLARHYAAIELEVVDAEETIGDTYGDAFENEEEEEENGN